MKLKNKLKMASVAASGLVATTIAATSCTTVNVEEPQEPIIVNKYLDEVKLSKEVVIDNEMQYFENNDLVNLYGNAVLENEVTSIIWYIQDINYTDNEDTKVAHAYLKEQNYVSKDKVVELNEMYGAELIYYLSTNSIFVECVVFYHVCSNFDEVVGWINDTN